MSVLNYETAIINNNQTKMQKNSATSPNNTNTKNQVNDPLVSKRYYNNLLHTD